jgi:hypothetical protein
MRIRDPWPGGDPDPQPEPVEIPTEVTYRVPMRHTLVSIGIAAVLVLGAWFAGEPAGWLICGLVAIGFCGYAARDLLAPVRLRADRHGVEVIRGYAGHARHAWQEIDRVRLDERIRLGREVQTLELDAGEALYILGARDLGAPPAEVAATLDALRSAAPPS